jgi:hypothetical protein
MTRRFLTRAATLAFCVVLAPLTASARGPEVLLRLDGQPQEVLAAEEMTCAGTPGEGIDVTDIPVTAFRRPDGTVLVLSGNSNGFFMAGPSVEEAARRGCDSLLSSERNGDPTQFRDKEWVLAMHTGADGTVYGFVHNEYHGENHGEADCRVRPASQRECWYASVTWIYSTDGGKTFRRPAAPGNLVIALPFEYRPKMPRAGVGMPKIMQRGEWLYMLASYHNRAIRGEGGQCLLRASAAKPTDWMVWKDGTFRPVEGSAYTFPDRPDDAPCDPVIGGNITSAKWMPDAGVFLGLGFSRDDVYYVTSRNLIDWSDPAVLFARSEALVDFEEADFADPGVRGDGLPKYFSLLDPDSPTAGFDTLGLNFYVYFVQYHSRDGRKRNDRRDVYRIPVAADVRR